MNGSDFIDFILGIDPNQCQGINNDKLTKMMKIKNILKEETKIIFMLSTRVFDFGVRSALTRAYDSFFPQKGKKTETDICIKKELLKRAHFVIKLMGRKIDRSNEFEDFLDNFILQTPDDVDAPGYDPRKASPMTKTLDPKKRFTRAILKLV